MFSEMLKEAQTILKLLGFDPGVIDGLDGPKTRAAAKAFQAKYGLVEDGIIGKQTLAALRATATKDLVGAPEPDKSAMLRPVPLQAVNDAKAAAPPNAFELLDTARPISELIIHCTATAEGKDYTVNDVRAWHKARGWSDIGYHYLVYRDGSIHVGRPVGQVGSHVAGHNTGTIGVAYVGGVAADGKTPKDTRTPAQRASLLWLANALVTKHRNLRKISGHNQYAAKACPSFDVRSDPLGKII